MTSRLKPRGRPYCEAFPALKVAEAVKAAGRARPVAQYENEREQVVGICRVSITGQGRLLELDATFYGNVNTMAGGGRATLPLTLKKGTEQPLAHCPCCDRAVGVFYWVHGRWACRTCHKLVHLSTRLTTPQRRWAERQELAWLIPHGRPLGMRQKRYEEMRQRLDELERELAGTVYVEPSEQLRYRVEASWHEVEDPALEARREQRSWSPTDTNGFKYPGFHDSYAHPRFADEVKDEPAGELPPGSLPGRDPDRPPSVMPWLGD